MTLHFGPFRLDLASGRLWKDATEVAVRRKPLAILQHLAKNPHGLVSQQELLAHVWDGCVVSNTARSAPSSTTFASCSATASSRP